jgi:hypothetical protein
MAGINNTLFGPLGEKYCFLFYLLSVVGLVFLIMTLASGLFMAFSGKTASMPVIFATVWLSIIYGIMYLQNRLLYSMCEKTI